MPGALELPGAIALAARSGRFCAFVALGVVIRGETYHFEIVSNESARGLMDLTLQGYAIGNGILTVENEAQAIGARRSRRRRQGRRRGTRGARPLRSSREIRALAPCRLPGPACALQVTRPIEPSTSNRHTARSPFPRCCSAMSCWHSGRGWCGLSDVGPVAAGFWRLVLALPFLWLLARDDRPDAALAERAR